MSTYYCVSVVLLPVLNKCYLLFYIDESSHCQPSENVLEVYNAFLARIHNTFHFRIKFIYFTWSKQQCWSMNPRPNQAGEPYFIEPNRPNHVPIKWRRKKKKKSQLKCFSSATKPNCTIWWNAPASQSHIYAYPSHRCIPILIGIG